MTEMLRSVKRDLGGGDGGPPGQDVLQATLLRFFKSGLVPSFTELKYVCYGVTVPVGKDQLRVIDQQPLLDGLVTMVSQRESQPKQFRRCYQGLLTGYFGFDWYGEPGDSAIDNWTVLRGYLHDRLKPTLQAAATRGGVPDWLHTLNAHHNLLTDDPCSRYAQALSRGDSAQLRDVCTGLGIAGSSWVWSDALMAYVRLVCEARDGGFRKGLNGILDLVNGRADIKLPAVLAVTATALSVARYASCVEKPEHADLRDTCVYWIGNPWLKRTAWDAHVNDEPARQMVDGWLKRQLIKDFFELLAQDGSAELGRLQYWLKWEPHITDMWFVLGADARNNRTPEFAELRKRMAGRDRSLGDTTDQNNAFVMRIGPLLVIEFGVTNNACFVFAASDFRQSLDASSLSVHVLKQRLHSTKLSHTPGWAYRFDQALKKKLESVPASKGVLKPSVGRPTRPVKTESSEWESYRNKHLADRAAVRPSPLPTVKQASVSPHVISTNINRRSMTQSEFDVIQRLCAQHNIEIEDNRLKKGALWILAPNRKGRLGLSSLLDRYGFRYVEGKGFWLKDEE